MPPVPSGPRGRAVGKRLSDAQVKQAARRAGMHLSVLADYCILPTAETAHTLVINFASIAPEQVGTAMRILEDSHGGADLLGHSVLRGPRRGCRPTRAFLPPGKAQFSAI